MPPTHVRTFRVRHYECEASNRVSHASYLRYMQEAAFDASAAVGYDFARYETLGCSWLIRETEIKYVQPLRYGDAVEVKTWVIDFRRVRSRRAYEFRRVGTDGLVAQAVTDWAFLETSSGRPVAIPEEMKTAFLPESALDSHPVRERFPAALPPSHGGFRRRRRVEWRDLDPEAHVNNAVYLEFVEDCGLQLLAARGWPPARLATQRLAFEARQHHIEYRLPAQWGEELEVLTWMSDVESRGVTRHSIVKRVRDDALLVRVRSVHSCVDLETGNAVAIPETLLMDLTSNRGNEGRSRT
jgi:acyl-CoA thioester hydrolase